MGDDLAQLLRWEQFGAVWEVVRRDRETVTVSLCRCDGGEEVARIVSDDPELVAYVSAPRP